MNYIETQKIGQNQEALDREWYERFEPLGAFQAYEYFEGNKEYRLRERTEFVNGEVENPRLDYPSLDSEKLLAQEQGLLKLKADILARESRFEIKQLYRWKINEKLAELRLLQAAANKDMRKFKKYSEFIYGKPSRDIFAYTMQPVFDLLQTARGSQHSDVIEACDALEKLLPQQTDALILQKPSQELIKKVGEATQEEFSHLIEIDTPDENHLYTAQEIAHIFSEALKKLNADGWKVALSSSSKTAISVNQEKREVMIPESRQLSLKKLQTLIAHEIGTHVNRRLSGERSTLLLLGLGLDRYESGEEGVATLREQALGTFDDFAGFDGYLAIGLGVGIDSRPRNFKEVFDILYRYYYIQQRQKGKSQADADASAETTAWNRCVRTFRGTDCSTRGVVFTKDIVYREGNIATWNLVSRDFTALHKFNIGKFHPAEWRHIALLEQAGVLDEDLTDLEEREL